MAAGVSREEFADGLPLAGLNASLEEIGASPAVQLFRERAGARQEESLKTARAGRVIGEICRRVDGLPRAIELAAARATGLCSKEYWRMVSSS